jgi:uncharacterized protein YmfQ (DUF2313 family)
MKTSDALVECLPPAAYDRSAPNVQREARAVADVIDASIDSSDLLVLEQQPATTVLALPDWERNHGLPDACIGGLSAPLPARLANLMERIKGRGNLSRPFYIDQAASLGYSNATITELGPMTCMDPCDSAPNGLEFIGVWRLNIPVPTVVVTMTCEFPCDSALNSWGNAQLECMVNRRKPSHTRAIFAYAT